MTAAVWRPQDVALAVVMALMAVHWLVAWRLHRRWRRAQGAVDGALRRAAGGSENGGPNSRAFVAFVWGGGHRRFGDPGLTRLTVAARVIGLMLLVAILMWMGSGG